uniref:AB hydrolase-1 domain-containing protein n=1 Tax=Emiliania huxleyi TaxID=2903 RepID=A0A7S3T993_EMIHU
MLAHTHARCGASDSEAAIVLLHGFLGDRRDVEPLRQKLGALADCISLDLPGHGDSAWMPTIDAGTSAVDAALATLEALCPPPARLLLVGYSMGGRVALQLAARLPPPRLAGLVILSGSPGLDDGALREARLSRDVALAARLRAMTPPHFDEWLRREWYRAALWGGRLQEHPSFERMLLRRTDGAQPRDRAASLERESVGRQPSCWPWLEAPPAPVLYVAGEEDEAYCKVATRLAEHSGVAEPVERRLVRVAVLPAAGHALLLEASAPVAEICHAFASQVLPPPLVPAPPPLSEGVRIQARGPEGVDALSARLLPFRLPLTAPLPLARGPPVTERAGVLLLVEGMAADGRAVRGLGEVCPLPGFHSESLDEAAAQLRSVAHRLQGALLPFAVARLDGSMSAWLAAACDRPSKLASGPLLPSVRCALEMACLHLLAQAANTSIAQLVCCARRAPYQSHVRINGLLARGEASSLEAAADAARAAVDSARPSSRACASGPAVKHAAARMRTWKVKVGGGKAASEDGAVAVATHRNLAGRP